MSARPLRALLVMGTRPEAIKLAPLYLALRDHPAFTPQLLLTAQHRELLDEPLALFGLTADVDLDLMQKVQDPLSLTGKAVPALGDAMRSLQPDVVLVQGDTTTAFCGAFAAYHLKIPVGHVEAGLRTGRRYEPFPEEMNRLLVAPLADVHFAPTVRARDALLREGHDEPSVLVVGNTVVDAVQHIAAEETAPPSHKRQVLLTCHRREAHGGVQRAMFSALRRVAESFDDVEFVFPVHPHPEVSGAAHEVFDDCAAVRLEPPLDYRQFVRRLKGAALVVTDSGGVQEEAPALGVPVVVLRNTTERQEGVDAGGAVLVGTDPERIERTVRALLRDAPRLQAMRDVPNPYGDGRASQRIAAYLEARLRDCSDWIGATGVGASGPPG